MSRIQVLPSHLAMKIAAGEVVERPAAAVKELLDNAIDAGARSIQVEIRAAGLKMIRVTDDGEGMMRDDVPLAFASHATSKIVRVEDLDNLTTLGFRGEALPSIAAIARVDVVTRAEGEKIGTHYAVEYGRRLESTGCAAPRGSRISVYDLFANVPARRKFVRSERAEAGQISTVVSQYVLACPHIKIGLIVDERPVLESPGTGTLSDAFSAAYNPSMLDSMVPVSACWDGVEVSGLISRPRLTRQNRSSIHTVVNGRPVSSRGLGYALEEAYSGYLMTGRHPVAVIHLRLAPGDIDVNVHPAKLEVRFHRERDVHGAVYRAVSDTLLGLSLETRGIEALATVGQDAPGESRQSLLQPAPEYAAVNSPVPALRVFGQANQAFIVAEGPSGLYMIDQHAAHERILFDRLDVAGTDTVVTSQPLLTPAVVPLTPGQVQAMEDNEDLLVRLGFQLEAFGDGACLVRSIPALIRGGSPTEAALEVLDELAQGVEPAAARERALASLACRAAVKAGQTLDVAEMREIVAQLEATDRPSTCPHGRPTMIHLSNSQLEREFGRR
ncbi:MAG: DNA mismatch repair endonuclease MutL [Chloroflexota bacterium]